MRLGVSTDTQDMTGAILKESEVSVTEEEIKNAASSFIGDQLQIPPMYSALKVNGKKLYELAREGKEVERKARPVHFYQIEILEIHLPLVKMRVSCSKGTYIRTLCHDMGEKLGCGGAMEALLRTKSGDFTLEQSMTLQETEEAVKAGTIEEKIISIEEVLSSYPAVYAKEEGDRLLANGNPLHEGLVKGDVREGWVRMYTSSGVFTGIYQWKKKRQQYFPVKMFV